MPKIVCVVPTIRPERMDAFREAWMPLFEKHDVALITVYDHRPILEATLDGLWMTKHEGMVNIPSKFEGLICQKTDACRNYGFAMAAYLQPDYIFTLDDDVEPVDDPIQAHLDALSKRVPLSWMNTAHDTDLYLRGFPYGIRDEAPVMLSHGVWVGVPDFDGETQLRLESESIAKGPYTRPDGSQSPSRLPSKLPYFVGPIPRGVLFPLCGMNAMIRREALPYFYFAPMGPDSGVTTQPKNMSDPNGSHVGGGLHRFADIFMGVFLKREFDRKGWACYTGASTVLHTRASDAKKNVEQEKLGRAWLEETFNGKGQWSTEAERYFTNYADKRQRWQALISGILGGKT